jgi:hypothetical protein
MARVTHVKRAQVRYPTVDVLDGDGSVIMIPVMKGGEQRTTKRGRQVFMKKTAEDRTQPPLPDYECDSCRNPILPGTPYKHISPKSGPYGGRKRTRHEGCPTWQVWEYSSSLNARLAQVEHDFVTEVSKADMTTEDGVQGALDDAANAIREIVGEKRDAADNIEQGFGHPTTQSEELEQLADDLESWADDIEAATIPEVPEPEEEDCDDCVSGVVEDDGEESDCETCGGSGQVTGDEPTDAQMEEWRDEVIGELTIVGECPV